MASVSSIAVSGLHAAQAVLDATAHNVANVSTPSFRRQQVVAIEQQGAGVTTTTSQAGRAGSALETDLVAQLQAKNAFLANLAVFKASKQMIGTLLDKDV